jgi:hypothetical protein
VDMSSKYYNLKLQATSFNLDVEQRYGTVLNRYFSSTSFAFIDSD